MRFFIERFLILILLAGTLLEVGCTSLPLVEKPRLELAGLRIDHMSLHDPQLGLILRAHNPNGFSIPLDQVEVAVELNERAFAEGHATEAVSLPAHGSALVEMTIHVHGDVLWTSFKEMLHTPGGSLRYRIRGSGKFGVLALPFSFDTPGSTDFDTLLGRNRPGTVHSE